MLTLIIELQLHMRILKVYINILLNLYNIILELILVNVVENNYLCKLKIYC